MMLRHMTKLASSDFYASIGIFGLLMVFDGIAQIQVVSSQFLGSVELIIGVFATLLGLLFLHFNTDSKPGLIESTIVRYLKMDS